MAEPCATCGATAPRSPSRYFCSDTCQQRWHQRRSVPIAPDHSPSVPAYLVVAPRVRSTSPTTAPHPC